MHGSFEYDSWGTGYTRHRREDPAIAKRIHAALGAARTVVNVGAGAGSYEPSDRWVLAVEPSSTMRSQRPPGAPPAIAAAAERLPIDDDAVDAAMACFTIHHWDDRAAGLAEMRRVARGPVVVFTVDLDALPSWQLDYFGQLVESDKARVGAVEQVADELGADARIETIPTPARCADGFVEAYWNRPEAFLDPEVRAAQSIWRRLEADEEEPIIARLRADLQSGAWDAAHGHLRALDEFDGSLRLIVSDG